MIKGKLTNVGNVGSLGILLFSILFIPPMILPSSDFTALMFPSTVFFRGILVFTEGFKRPVVRLEL